MSYEDLLLERDGNVARVAVNRPKKLNALSSMQMKEGTSAFLEKRSANFRP